jgi:hypothetical protein
LQGISEGAITLERRVRNITHDHGKSHSFCAIARGINYVVIHHELPTHVPVDGSMVPWRMCYSGFNDTLRQLGGERPNGQPGYDFNLISNITFVVIEGTRLRVRATRSSVDANMTRLGVNGVKCL